MLRYKYNELNYGDGVSKDFIEKLCEMELKTIPF